MESKKINPDPPSLTLSLTLSLSTAGRWVSDMPVRRDCDQLILVYIVGDKTLTEKSVRERRRRREGGG